MSDCWPRANRSAETGCPSAKRRSYRSVSSASLPQSMDEGGKVIGTLSVAEGQVCNYFRINSNLEGSFPHSTSQVNGHPAAQAEAPEQGRC